MSKFQYYNLDRSNNSPTIINASGNGLIHTGATGIIAAGLAANSVLVGIRVLSSYQLSGLDSVRSQGLPVYLERAKITYTCTTAFTTPITAGRSLILQKATISGASGGLITGGQALNTGIKGNGASSPQPFDTSVAGTNLRIATTTGLTLNGPVVGSQIIGRMPLTGHGNAGNSLEYEYLATGEHTSPAAFFVEQAFLISNPQAMDAGGQFELTVELCWQYLPLRFYQGPVPNI